MFLALVPLLLMTSGQAPPPQQPQTPPASAVRQRPAPRPQYDEKAEAQTLIDAAVAAAAEDDIRVLINWGNNDDPRCAAFPAARRESPELSGKFSDEYKLVSVDVGHADKNLALAERYKVKLDAHQLPAFTVLDAKGAVIAQIASTGLVSASEPPVLDAKVLAGALTKYQTSAPPAQPLFDAAMAEARRQDKLVFVWFAAPW